MRAQAEDSRAKVTVGRLAGRSDLYRHALDCEERCYQNAQRDRVRTMIPMAQASLNDPESPDREFWSRWMNVNREAWPELFQPQEDNHVQAR